tara:strand:- start:6118 stop:7746 length:1629 start_codon:yes stop_codon:yes gene_type:complete
MSTPTSKIQHVSASQFKTFSRCKRKWFIEKCTDAPRPEPSKAMALGTAVHAVLEEYLRDGVEPDEETRAGRIAASGLHLLPEGVLEIETEIKLQDIEPPLLGYIDVLDLTEPWMPVVIDHKTTSSWDWAKTEEELRCDPQMISYARYALDECSAADTVEVCHIQYKTKGAPEARRVSALLDREHVDDQWEKLKQLATEIKATSLFDDVEEVEPNLSACGDFGGCPYADTCAAFGDSPSPFAGIETIETEKEDEMTRLEELLQRRKAKKAPPILSQDAAPRTEEPPPVVEEEQGGAIPPWPLRDALGRTFVEPVPGKDKYSDEQYSEAASALLAFMRGRDVRSIGNVSARPIVGKVLIHNDKPLGRVRPYYVEKACHMSEGTLTYDKGTVVRGSSAAEPAPQPEVDAAPVEAAPVEAAPVEAAPPKPEVKVKPKEEKLPKGKQVPASSLVVYVDCLPTKRHPNSSLPQMFEEVIAPHVEAVAKKNKVATPLLMPYGEGKNHVAGLLRVKPPTGCVTVTSDNPYWPACKTVLLQVADVVITGIK